jgi:hypothetical protein
MSRRVLLLALVAVVSFLVPVLAHQETHKGTVIGVESAGVRMNVVDPKTKKTEPRLFEVDKETKVLRDDKLIAYADAKMVKGEAIAVTVDHDIDEHLALVIRLGNSK